MGPLAKTSFGAFEDRLVKKRELPGHAAFGKVVGHSAKGLFVVSRIERFFSYRRVTTSRLRDLRRSRGLLCG